jgi:uncharacterized protein (TIGR01244 family)
MNVVWLDDETAISSPIGPDGVAGAADAGFLAIINNRPDGEEDHQPNSHSIEFAAKNRDLAYRHVPISIRALSMEDVAAMRSAIDETPSPRVAFCRSGARSYLMWALTKAEDGHDLDGLIDQAAERGYDISMARMLLQD